MSVEDMKPRKRPSWNPRSRVTMTFSHPCRGGMFCGRASGVRSVRLRKMEQMLDSTSVALLAYTIVDEAKVILGSLKPAGADDQRRSVRSP